MRTADWSLSVREERSLPFERIPKQVFSRAASYERTGRQASSRVSLSDIQFRPQDSHHEHDFGHDQKMPRRPSDERVSEIHFQPLLTTSPSVAEESPQVSLNDIEFQPKYSGNKNEAKAIERHQGSSSSCNGAPWMQPGEWKCTMPYPSSPNDAEIKVSPRQNETQSSTSNIATLNTTEIEVAPRQQNEEPTSRCLFSTEDGAEAKEINLDEIFSEQRRKLAEGFSSASRSSSGGQVNQAANLTAELRKHFACQRSEFGLLSTRSSRSVASGRPTIGSQGSERIYRLPLQTSRRGNFSMRSILSSRSYLSSKSSFSGSNSSLSFFFTSSRLDCPVDEPSYLAPAPDAESVVFEAPCSETQSIVPSTNEDLEWLAEIEVSPGYFLRLRGAEETWAAMLEDKCSHACCPYCGIDMIFISEVEFVLCPDCRDICPSDVGRAGSGVGLGVNAADLVPGMFTVR